MVSLHVLRHGHSAAADEAGRGRGLREEEVEDKAAGTAALPVAKQQRTRIHQRWDAISRCTECKK
jgi:hypothetical protein